MSKIDFKDIRSLIGKRMLADGMDPVIDLDKSHGSWLVDGNTGREYLDLFSMFASLSVGYNHPYVLKNKNRLTSAAINKPTNSDVYSLAMAEFVETMGRLAQPQYLPYSFFISGGSLAVENALKTAFDWKVRLNISKGKGEKGSKVIHFKQAFHGRSGYTMSITDSPDPRKVMYFPQFDWPRISNPSVRFPLNNNSQKDVEKREQIAKEEIKSAIKEYPDDIACIIIEPIQGEGGDNHFRPDFFIFLKQICLENDMLLIYDEVQTGVGITGKMWAHQHLCSVGCTKKCNTFCLNTEPDIMSFGKKTQVCGIFAGKRLDMIDNHVFKESSRINSTWGGNLVDMVRFTIYLEIIESEKLINNAAIMGDYLHSKLVALEEKYSNLLSNSRGKGLFCAIDLPSSKQRDKVINFLYKEGALVLGSGSKSVRFRPHLNISKNEIDIAIDMLDKSVGSI